MDSLESSLSRSRKTHLTDKQRYILVSLMKDHEAFARGELIGKQGRAKTCELWQTLANKLNACGDGVAKDISKWQKTWGDWKGRVKAKAAAMMRHQKGTGGGSPFKDLSRLDQLCLDVLTVESVLGDDDLPEGGARPAEIFNQLPSAACGKATAGGAPLLIAEVPAEMPVDYEYVVETLPQHNEESQPSKEKKIKPTLKEKATSEDIARAYVRGQDASKVLEEEKLKVKKRRLALEEDRLLIEKAKLQILENNSTAYVAAAASISNLANTLSNYYLKK